MPHKPLTEKLERFSSQIAASSDSKAEFRFPERYRLLADALGGELVPGGAGCYCRIRTLYPAGYSHGLFTINSTEETKSFPSAAFSTGDPGLDLPASSMVFLDTETTGLGGTGTVAFLIGLGRINGNGFEIIQYLIPDYSDEAAMLQDVYENLNRDSTIVSFNGASFDIPVLLDRMIINRVTRRFEFGYHLDLLHPARRLFKRRLLDCTLINLERQLFSFYRADDIPGYLVPSVYFEWLTSQELSRMNSVLKHNRCDIISLYFLARLLAEAYQSEGEILTYSEDLYSLSRFFERRKETGKIEKVYQRVQHSPNGLAPEAALHYARNFKRTQNIKQSVEIWESLAGDKTSHSFWACLELAKYYEHEARNVVTALEYSDCAAKCKPINERQLRELKKRVTRLNRKLHRLPEN